MITVFFTKNGVIHIDFKDTKGGSNTEYYIKNGLKPMLRGWKKQQRNLGKDPFVVPWFHQDNAPSHKSMRTKAWLEKNKIDIMPAPPYSPDLAPCDFWLFPNIKRRAAGIIFDNLNQVKKFWINQLNSLQPADFDHCFLAWRNRMDTVIRSKGEFIV